MRKRVKLSPRVNRKVFNRGARRVHAKNVQRRPMRGGIRL